MVQEQGLEQYGEVAEGILVSVATDTGTSDRGDWVLYKLTLDSGQEYSQFASDGGLPPKNTPLEKVQESYIESKKKDEYLKIKLAYRANGQYKNITAITKTGMASKEDLPKEVLDLDKYMKPRHPQDVVAMTYISSYERAVALYAVPHLFPQLAGATDGKFNFDVIDELAEHIANTVLVRSGYREIKPWKDPIEGTEAQD
jgi:hypothetical protein